MYPKVSFSLFIHRKILHQSSFLRHFLCTLKSVHTIGENYQNIKYDKIYCNQYFLKITLVMIEVITLKSNFNNSLYIKYQINFYFYIKKILVLVKKSAIFKQAFF